MKSCPDKVYIFSGQNLILFGQDVILSGQDFILSGQFLFCPDKF